MRMTIRSTTITGLTAALPLLVGPVAGAGELWYDFFEPYLQRIEGVTPGAGNAKEVNAATHIIDPWPRYGANRRIPGNGERMVGAIERYRDVRKLPLTPPPISQTPIGVSSFGGTGTTAPATTTTTTAPTTR